ncbi:MAG: hypothetical protein WC467_02365 [Patescibacteria group bacterium]
MHKNIPKFIDSLLIFLTFLLLLILFYSYFFPEITVTAYRLVTIFLSVIILSNLAAKLLENYFKHIKS